MDQLFGEAASAAPDAAFLLTADHGMNHKTKCWDLEKACAKRGTPIRIAISVERDKYPKHHRGHGGVSWVKCNRSQGLEPLSKTLSEAQGRTAWLSSLGLSGFAAAAELSGLKYFVRYRVATSTSWSFS